MNTQLQLQEEAKERVFQFWNKIPMISFQDLDKLKIINQEIRSEILDLLRVGIEESRIIENKEIKHRHALNAKEIMEYVSERMNQSLKLSNIYFHLQQLEENGFIMEVASVREGKHNVRYYGRIAKVFVFIEHYDDPDKQKKEVKYVHSQISRLLKEINPKYNQKKLKILLNDIFRYQKVRFETMVEWFEKQSETLEKANINVLKLYSFLELNRAYDQQGVELYKELLMALNIPFPELDLTEKN